MLYWVKFNDTIAIELPLIILFCLLGAYIIIFSNNFFVLYMGIEVQSLGLYILVGSKKYSNLSIEAALKYFIIGSFASGVLLLGVSLIYIFVGILV